MAHDGQTPPRCPFPFRCKLHSAKSITPLLDMVSGDAPPPILVLHGSERFNRRLLVCEGALKLNDHILSIRRTGQRLAIFGTAQLPGIQPTKRRTSRIGSLRPLLLGDLLLE